MARLIMLHRMINYFWLVSQYPFIHFGDNVTCYTFICAIRTKNINITERESIIATNFLYKKTTNMLIIQNTEHIMLKKWYQWSGKRFHILFPIHTCIFLFIVVLLWLQYVIQTVSCLISMIPLYTCLVPYHKDNLSFAFICIKNNFKTVPYHTPSWDTPSSPSTSHFTIPPPRKACYLPVWEWTRDSWTETNVLQRVKLVVNWGRRNLNLNSE